MVEHSKRKKFHDKDKYYRLAKEQGLRSRAAFKLSQINRKFRLLENARVVLDLCAAPGGWTQVASKTASKQSLLVAVDILPIRPLGRNVITIVGDITTDSCKSEIKRELQGAPVDVVLHDGAPNVGASFDKDAYEQNEIALHAMRCATQHLNPNGSFVTKLYRSRDYASYVWVAKQLFKRVQAVKPTASRSQSAEIFLVCQEYLAPDKLDPRMLDPKCIFEQVEGDSTGGGNAAGVGKNFNVFHKSWDSKRRQRDGYDMTRLDATMRHVQPVSYFIDSKLNTVDDHIVKDPIALLSTCTGMTFSCQECKNGQQGKDSSNCYCRFFLEHPRTTPEVKACLTDFKVLNKSDFKGLLTWRNTMKEALKNLRDEENVRDGDEESAPSSDDEVNHEKDSDQEEDEIQAEIAEMRRRRMRERKKLKKKERAVAAKRRKRAALGMDLNAIDVPDNEKIFTLATISSKGDLEAAREVDLGKATDKQLNVGSDDDEEFDHDKHEVESQGEQDDLDEMTGYSYRLDRELDEAYDLYLRTTKDGTAKSGTRMAKRSKKLQRQKAVEQANEDAELTMAGEKGISQDTETYAKMLQGGNQDDDDSEDEEDRESDDDGFHADPKTPKEAAATKKATKMQKVAKKEANPLIYKLPDDPSSVKTARWFSNPLFERIGSAAQLASMSTSASKAKAFDDNCDSDEHEAVSMDSSGDNGDEVVEKRGKGLNAEDVLAMMPKTDKQIRHERRVKAVERENRKKARRAKRAGEDEKEFEVAPAANIDGKADEDEIIRREEKLVGLSEEQKNKMLKARELIKAGMGVSVQDDKKSSSRFEVVSAETMDRPLPIMDTRKYDSENEDYDSDDYAQTLALGTMMLRRSKAKALVDASYNRYAWNDPSDLPDWFVDDENKHYRPQLPIPPALLQKMKDKVMHLSTKPIAKVAEARARKNKRARTKLAAAKKKAEAVANSSEMSEAMKLKAISKAMRGQDAKRPGRAYVVSKKGGGTKGAKGAKMVDKRMKSDKRGMDRAEKKRKGGKAGGRSKKRRR